MSLLVVLPLNHHQHSYDIQTTSMTAVKLEEPHTEAQAVSNKYQ